MVHLTKEICTLRANIWGKKRNDEKLLAFLEPTLQQLEGPSNPDRTRDDAGKNCQFDYRLISFLLFLAIMWLWMLTTTYTLDRDLENY